MKTNSAGRDATEDFEDVGHSDEARDMLPKMYKGDLTGPVSIAMEEDGVSVCEHGRGIDDRC